MKYAPPVRSCVHNPGPGKPKAGRRGGEGREGGEGGREGGWEGGRERGRERERVRATVRARRPAGWSIGRSVSRLVRGSIGRSVGQRHVGTMYHSTPPAKRENEKAGGGEAVGPRPGQHQKQWNQCMFGENKKLSSAYPSCPVTTA